MNATVSQPVAGRLERLGHALRRHQRAIRFTQWAVVAFYAVLVVLPALLPLPDRNAHILSNLTLLAQFVFWGIWWPFVLLSMVLVGRSWCGLFCPEGHLAEWSSRHGLGRATPRWMRWGGWPFVAFCLTTIFGQLVSVYQYPQAALLVLGGSTLAAIGVGLIYGRNTRVWCKHLCPVNGVFAVLSRLSPLHFRADEARWTAHSPGGVRPQPIHCAPMVHLRRLDSPADCHMCGRCSGHRGAMALEARPPNQEIARLTPEAAKSWDLLLIVYGLLGVAMGAFQWNASPWFIDAKQSVALWLINRNWMAPLDTNAPWWLLTHYPQHNDVFSWLDGALIVAYIVLTALLLGSAVLLSVAASARLDAGSWWRNTVRRAYCLVPLGGCGVILGLSALTVTLLAGEGLHIPHLLPARLTLLSLAAAWSLWLALRQTQGGLARRLLGMLLLAPGVGAVMGLWLLQWMVW